VSERRARLRRLAPWVSLLIIVLIWQAAVTIGGAPPMLLPRPAQTAVSLWESLASGEILPHIGATLSGAAIGYLAGSLIAIMVASAMATVPLIERLLMLHIVAFQAIPKVALAPLVFIWFGFGTPSTVALVTLSCFYPVFVNTFSGIRATDPNLIALMQACHASRWHLFRTVQLPAAAGQIFVGLQIGVVFALISAVVMEFVNGSAGLGYTIQAAATTLNTASVFAALLLLAFIGITASTLLRIARRKIVFWEGESSDAAQLH
jgi:NitT/TauT family transport system permease protein